MKFGNYLMMRVSKVDIGPLRALRSRVPSTFRTLSPQKASLRALWERQPIWIRFARADATCQIPAESATSHVGRVMKSISHFCASTSGRRLMTLISFNYIFAVTISLA